MTEADLAAIRERREEWGYKDLNAFQYRRDVGDLLEEIDRLTAIVSNVRRCPNCHRETIVSRAVVEAEDEEEPGDKFRRLYQGEWPFAEEEPTE